MNVILTVLGLALAVVVVMMLVALIAALVSLRALKRRNAVSPGTPSEAPLTWLASPAGAARLHRRLRSAASVARMVTARSPDDRSSLSSASLAAQVESEALALDRHLSRAARLARPERNRVLRQIGADVTRIEQLASRLSLADAASAAPARLPEQQSNLQELAEQLDHLEAARRELAETEARAGLRSPSPLPPPSSSPDRSG